MKRFSIHRLRGRRLRLTLTDESRLLRLWSVRTGPLRIGLCVLALLAVGFLAGFLTVGFSPVKRSMPGYMTADDRTQTIRTLMRMDSLQRAMEINQAFMDNLSTILDTSRQPSDSTARDTLPGSALTPDSLIGSSPRERKFVAMMEDNEKYNLQVLSPLAAESMIWADPAPGGVILESSRTLPLLRILMPKGRGVAALADGRVVDRVYDASTHSYSLLVQHDKGFLSRYSSLGVPLVEKGEALLSGQLLSQAGPSSSIGIEIWRDGTPLLPAEYVHRPSRAPKFDPAAPRGK